ncbi:MAG: hypothetical protein HOV81_12905 [Kofleriaceae bacterium]|nr:hypothetical protein [Kofleriaceae bacterium]
MRALIPLVLLAGCADDTYVIVTVDSVPAVHDMAGGAPKSLKVTLSNAGSMRTDDLVVAEHAFPVTFSLSAPGRTGDLGITVDALDAQGALIGRGSSTVSLDDTTASVKLDSADFVVNSEVVNNQFLSSDYEAAGLQLAATSSGNWMAVYRDECTMCDVFGRRFNSIGMPLDSALSASNLSFKVTTATSTTGTIPTVVSSGTTTLVLWDFFVGSTNGIACRAINDSGAATTNQVAVMTTETPDVVTAAPLANGNFVVTWQTYVTPNYQVHATVVKPDCTQLLAGPRAVSTAAVDNKRSHVAVNGTTVMYTWVGDDSVRIRGGLPNGDFNTAIPESVLVPKTTAQTVDHVRIVPYGTGFAIGARWSSTSGIDGPGKIEVYRISATGAIQGAATLITDQSLSDFTSDRAFGMAARADGALLVTWHACATGPGSCEVYGRLMRPDGTLAGETFVIPTTTGSDQVTPSAVALDTAFVVAWTDSSAVEPDPSGTAVRARILYPVYDAARTSP